MLQLHHHFRVKEIYKGGSQESDSHFVQDLYQQKRKSIV